MNATTRKPSRIQKEIAQRKPFHSPQQEAGVALLRTADVVRRRIARFIEPAGITGQQYNVLRILRGANDEGLPTLEIARRMIEQTPGITRLLDRLERRRLVRRERCASDRRQVLCWITQDGQALLEGLDATIDRADQEVLGRLDLADLSRLIELLDTIRSEDA
jgi:DNA-binding MarR family transcriptional regulator